MIIIVFRTLIIYFSLLLTMRIMGKRQLGEMELSEFVVAALIADLASHPLQDIGIPMINGLVPIIVLFCCEVLIAWLSNKSTKLSYLLFGKPCMLIRNGVINQREMSKNRFTSDELMQELRNSACLDVSQVKYAILETDGRVNVIKFADELPVSAKQMGKEAGKQGFPLIVVSNGRIITENLVKLGHNEAWLKETLAEHECGPKDVFLMTVDDNDTVYLSKKENNI